jgi:hypothetical protein
MVPWRRSLTITGIQKAFTRTVPLLNYHTAPWGKTLDPSESRMRKETISSALTEYGAIVKYRINLLNKEDSATAWICAYIDTMLTSAIQKGKGRQYPGGVEGLHTITWPDGMEYDSMKIPDKIPFNVLDENERSLMASFISLQRCSIH